MARRRLRVLAVFSAILLVSAACGEDRAEITAATTTASATGAQTVSVTVGGVTNHPGHELAGVLYAGNEPNNLDADALGGFWAVIDTDDFTTTQTLRTPATEHTGRFPFVTNTALSLDPGTYTLVIWVDHSLGGPTRWVPINTDGQGLYGCHVTFDIATEPNTAITVPANLQPDGWNVDCVTGVVTPDTDAAAAVSPFDD